MDKVYVVERRKYQGNTMITEDSDCFVSFSLERTEKWLKDNCDYDTRLFYWWWVILKCDIDDEFGGEMISAYDWDGNKLECQPSPKEYEHNDDEGYEYTLLRQFDSSNPDYVKFRQHYTIEIREEIERNGKFVMTDGLASTIILDVTEMIKNLGYKIVKEN